MSVNPRGSLVESPCYRDWSRLADGNQPQAIIRGKYRLAVQRGVFLEN
jgi:hypothetical protein